MSKKKEEDKKPEWFRAYGQWGSLFNNPRLGKEKLADMILLAFQYFYESEIRDIDSMGIEDDLIYSIFRPIKESIDRSITEYQDSVRYGKQGANKRYGKTESEEGGGSRKSKGG